MTLHEYMASAAVSDAELAIKLGCSEGAVKKWRYRERTPRPDQLRRIMEVTDGAVTANDFMLEPAPSPASQHVEAAE